MPVSRTRLLLFGAAACLISAWHTRKLHKIAVLGKTFAEKAFSDEV